MVECDSVIVDVANSGWARVSNSTRKTDIKEVNSVARVPSRRTLVVVLPSPNPDTRPEQPNRLRPAGKPHAHRVSGKLTLQAPARPAAGKSSGCGRHAMVCWETIFFIDTSGPSI